MKEVMGNQRIQYSNSVILYFLTTKVSMVLCMFDLTFISDINNPRNRFLPIPLYFPCLPEFEKGSRLFIYVYCSGIFQDYFEHVQTTILHLGETKHENACFIS